MCVWKGGIGVWLWFWAPIIYRISCLRFVQFIVLSSWGLMSMLLMESLKQSSGLSTMGLNNFFWMILGIRLSVFQYHVMAFLQLKTICLIVLL